MAEFLFIVVVVAAVVLVLFGGSDTKQRADRTNRRRTVKNGSKEAEGSSRSPRSSEAEEPHALVPTRQSQSGASEESVGESSRAGASRGGAAELRIPGEKTKVGTPIPPRPDGSGTPQISLRKEDWRSPTYVDSQAGQFVEQAQRLVDRTEPATAHVPFKAYWSTYEDMDRQQLGWYLYWRDRFRHGEVLDTDLSYVFVHVYECLHALGFDSPDAALGYLLNLWSSYRPQHPKLDNYLLPWILDFNAYYELGRDPLDLVDGAIKMGATVHDPDLWIETWLRGKDFDALDEDDLKRLCGFDPRTGKFYREATDRVRMLATLRAVLHWTDEYFSERDGMSVFEAYAPTTMRRIRHTAFAGAVFEYERRTLEVAAVRPFSTEEPLRDLLASALKLAENVLRSQASFRGARRGIELPEGLESHLRQRLSGDPAQPQDVPGAPRRRIHIDHGRVDRLEEESAAIRNRLSVGGELDGAPDPPQARSARFDLPGDLAPGLLTDVDAVAATLDALPGGDLRLLHDARADEWEIAAVSSDADPERIALVSSTHLGASLVHHERSYWVVEDDYRDELEFLLDREEFAAPAASSVEDVPGTANDSGEEGADAHVLRRLLTPVHVHALTKIAERCSREALADFAVKHGTMSELLVEEINEHAMDVIGDVLVNAYEDPFMVLDEHRGLVSRLVDA